MLVAEKEAVKVQIVIAAREKRDSCRILQLSLFRSSENKMTSAICLYLLIDFNKWGVTYVFEVNIESKFT